MKLIIQIPCLNEAATLPEVLKQIPKEVEGVDTIEILIIDDGSDDGTAQIARSLGVQHVVKHTRNLGLAFAFRHGLDASLKLGADIIVNMDGDNQYKATEIPKLIAPIINNKADIVIGNRGTDEIEHFSLTKKFLQKLGSFTVRKLSRTGVIDATSGFRAFSRDAAMKLTILSNYTYTLESILQVHSKGLAIENVRIEVNDPTRPSRLMKNTREYLKFSVATIIRVFTMYNPLRVFVDLGAVFVFIGVMIFVRFVYFYLVDGGDGHIQSLIFAAVAFAAGVATILVGLIADLIQFNRRLLEEILVRVRKLEHDD